MTNQGNNWIKQARKNLIKEFGGKCFDCGSKQNLCFHHVKKTNLGGLGRGRKERYYDVIQNRTSYILICRSCHAKHH